MPETPQPPLSADGQECASIETGRLKAKAAATQRLSWAVRQAGGNKLVAQRSGVPLGTLNNYMRGRHGMKTKTLQALALACNVPLGWIVSGDPSPPGAAVFAMQQPMAGLSDAPPAPAPVPTSHAAAPDWTYVPASQQDGLNVPLLAKAIDILRGITGTPALNEPSPELAQRLATVYAVLVGSKPPADTD
jgi:transcriptional regulator with XRE-family HTH domain